MPPASDRIDHTIHAQLAADGSLQATVVEQRFGYAAERPRVTFTAGSQQQQRDYLEDACAAISTVSRSTNIAAAHSTELSQPLELDYSFRAANYARSAGDLLLVRSGILGSDAWSPPEARAWPIDLSAVQTRTDHIDLVLPPATSSTSFPIRSRSTPTSPPTTAPSPPTAPRCTTPASTP